MMAEEYWKMVYLKTDSSTVNTRGVLSFISQVKILTKLSFLHSVVLSLPSEADESLMEMKCRVPTPPKGYKASL